jgi:hypothetical protein
MLSVPVAGLAECAMREAAATISGDLECPP